MDNLLVWTRASKELARKKLNAVTSILNIDPICFYFRLGLGEVTFNGAQSSAMFIDSIPFSNIQSLVIQFRTRQNSTGLLASSGDNKTLFEVGIAKGSLVISFHLSENLTGIIDTGKRDLRVICKNYNT